MGGRMGQNWEVNWEVQRCKLGGSTGQNWGVQRCRIERTGVQNLEANWALERRNIVRRIGKFHDAILARELGGRTVQYWEVAWHRIGRVNCAILGGELQDSTMPNLQ